jgi:Glycosyl transferases group 1
MARILIISDLWLPFPGGAERMIANITDALAERGHKIKILTSYAKARSKYSMMITDIGVGERHAEGWEFIQEFIWESNPEVLLTHHYFSREFPQLFQLPIPSVQIVHNGQRSEFASLAIFNSQFTAKQSPMGPQDMVILPPAGNDVIAEGNPFQRECIGHIKPIPNHFWKGKWYGKGIDLTYRLAWIMSERKFLVLRGEWQDCERIDKLDNIEFMEPVDDIREFYARCRLVLMPSSSEDAGTVGQECALNGIPCISSNVGGLIETNAGGIVLPPHDILPWLNAVAAMDNLDHYNDVVRRQRLYVAMLDWPKQFDELSKKIEALV